MNLSRVAEFYFLRKLATHFATLSYKRPKPQAFFYLPHAKLQEKLVCKTMAKAPPPT